jgi:HEAT repeat protein
MPTLDTLATRFARCVSLFRDPSAKSEQKKEFRALVGLLQDTAVTLRIGAGGGGIELNGVPCEGEGLAVLVERLDLHGIGEIALPANPPPSQLFELLQALADQPGAHDVASRLAAAGADGIRIAPGGPPSPPSAPARPEPAPSTEDFGGREPVVPNPDTPVDRKSGALGTAGILRGESMRDIKSVPLEGVPLVTHDPPPPKAADALPGVVDRARPPRNRGAEELLSLSSERHLEPEPPRAAPARPSSPPPAPPPAAPEPPPAATRGAARAPAARATPTERVALPPGAAEVLADLERNSTAPNVGDLLAALIDHAASATQLGRFEQVLGVIAGVLRVEERVPESSGVRRQYGIALRRFYTKPVLEGLSRLLAAPKHRAAAVRALQRGGAAGVEVLMDVLAAAPTVGERRAVFDALKHMTEGTDQLVHMLDHSEWFVVRNVAELIGELGMDAAVPALGKRLDHPDERVRKAVGLALAKIGTRSAAEPLRRALRDRSQEVRMQVAVGIGGRKSSALAMPLVVAMEEEKDEAVVRELILALGRIGSPDAVQALIKWAQPTGRFFGRKPSELRVAAVEALRLAATPAALGTLEGLSDDGDRTVRDAATRAVTELKRKKGR